MSKKSKKQYARAEVISPFLGSGGDVIKACLSIVVSPMAFVRRVIANKIGKLAGVEYIASREAGYLSILAEDFLANADLPSNTKCVRIKFMLHSSLSSSLSGGIFLVFVSFRVGHVEILGKKNTVVALVDWLNVPFSEFEFILPSSDSLCLS